MTIIQVTVLSLASERANAEITRESALANGLERVTVRFVDATSVEESIAGYDCRYALAAFRVLADDDADVHIVMRAGGLFRRFPTLLVHEAEARGLCLPQRRLPEDVDFFEPWAGTIAEQGASILDVLASGRTARPFLAEMITRCDAAMAAFNFDEPAHYLNSLHAYRPDAMLDGVAVLDPAYLTQGDDVPNETEIVVLPRFSASSPWVPDSSLDFPRVTIEGRPRLAALLSDAATRSGDTVSPDGEIPVSDYRELNQILRASGAWKLLPRQMSLTEFDEWLKTPVAGMRHVAIPRGLFITWEWRTDLKAAFPAVPGIDEERLWEWGRDDRGWAGGAGARIVGEKRPIEDADVTRRGSGRGLFSRIRGNQEPEGIEAHLRPARVDGAPGEVAPGTLVFGLLDSVSGLGNVARQLRDDLTSAGVSTSGRTWETGGRSKVGPPVNDGPARATAISVLGAEAEFHTRIPPDFRRADQRAGVLFWEIDCLVPGVEEFASTYSEMWAPSGFIKDVLSAQTDLPVHVMPQHASAVLNAHAPANADEQRAAQPYALFVFDHHSCSARKNPTAVIDAFARSVAPEDGARLIVKSINGDQRRRAHAEVLYHANKYPHVEVIDGMMEKAELESLMANASAYVSLHRGEGLGLTIAEAMALGVPAIATGYGGNLDFMDDSCGYLIPYSMVPVGIDGRPYPADAVWADADVDAAAAAIRTALSGGSDVRAKAELGRERVREVFARERVLEFLRDRGVVSH